MHRLIAYIIYIFYLSLTDLTGLEFLDSIHLNESHIEVKGLIIMKGDLSLSIYNKSKNKSQWISLSAIASITDQISYDPLNKKIIMKNGNQTIYCDISRYLSGNLVESNTLGATPSLKNNKSANSKSTNSAYNNSNYYNKNYTVIQIMNKYKMAEQVISGENSKDKPIKNNDSSNNNFSKSIFGQNNATKSNQFSELFGESINDENGKTSNTRLSKARMLPPRLKPKVIEEKEY